MMETLPPIDQLTEEKLMNYIEHFLDIGEFRKIDNGKMLLSYLREYPEHPKIKNIVRKVLGLFNTQLPGAKVCSLQFIKEAIETDSWAVVEAVEKILLPKVTQIIQYRSHIHSLQRGMTYFITSFDKNSTDEQVMNLTKLSSTFFRMIHQCVYIWGAQYFPGSSFDRLRMKLQKKFEFPQKMTDFRFFNEKKIQNFKQNCLNIRKRMGERKDDLRSQSSVEKRRENSIKPGRVSSQVKNNQKSQSMDKVEAPSPRKMTKQLQKQYNQKLRNSKIKIEVTQESDLEPFSSELNDYPLNIKHSPKSQHSFQERFPLKKYTSQQLIPDQPYKSTSLKEPNNEKGGLRSPVQLSRQSKADNLKQKVPPLPMEQLRNNKLKDQRHHPYQVPANSNKSGKDSQKIQSRSSKKRKFVSSEEQDARVVEVEQIELPAESKKVQNNKKAPSKISQQKKIKQFQPAQQIKLTQRFSQKDIQKIDKPAKTSKPKKIKGDESARSIFQEVKQHKAIDHQAPSKEIIKKLNPYIPKKELQKIVNNNSKQQAQKGRTRQNQQPKDDTSVLKQMLGKKAVKNDQSSVDQVKKSKLQKEKEKQYHIEETEEITFVKKIDAQPTIQGLKTNKPIIRTAQKTEKINMNDIKEKETLTPYLIENNRNSVQTSPSNPQTTFRTLLYDTSSNPAYSIQRNQREAIEKIQPSGEEPFRSFYSSRLKKYNQVSLSISPGEISISEANSRIRISDTDELKLEIQKQLKQQFNKIQLSLLQQQHSSLTNNFEQLRNKVLEQQKVQQSIGVQCSMPEKHRTKVKYYRRKQFMDQSNEGEGKAGNVRSQSVGIQADNIIDRKQKNNELKISNNGRKKGKEDISKKAAPGIGEYQPNTLLYALYRKRSMNV